MLNILMVPVVLGLSGPPNDVVKITAKLDATELEVGKEYEIVLEIKFAEGFTASNSSANPGGTGRLARSNTPMPAAMLQIDVPASIELSGRVLTSFRELSRNEFIQEPYERLLKESPARIKFKLTKAPGAGETIGLNVTGFVNSAPGEDDFFLRQRLELPVKAGAEAQFAAPENSNWGVDKNLLNVGDKAADFTLPKADGTKVTLSDYIGKKNIIVTTYRAEW